MKNSIFLISLLSAFGLVACSPHERRDPVRNVDPVSVANMGVTQASSLESPLLSSLEAESVSACDRLGELGQARDEANAGTFSYLGQILPNGAAWNGALEIGESPLTQFILGESFQVPNWDEFYRQAQQEHANGKVSGMKWFLLNMMHAVGLGDMAQISAINGKLEEAFPGIFGASGKLDDSLHWKIANRAATFNGIRKNQIIATLTKKLPLFPGDGAWASHAENTRKSLAAAIRALRGDAQQERLCGLVLLHQNFSQLLRAKGHLSPEIIVSPRAPHATWIEKLSASHQQFYKSENLGAFYNLGTNQRVSLQSDDIKNYSPANGLVTVTAQIPKLGNRGTPGSLSDSLAFMEAMLYSYEASSPAQNWVTTDNYLYGDIKNESGHALLPAEAHQLSLGLLTMQFKNLAAVYVKKVNVRGVSLRDGETAAGLVLAGEATARGVVKVRLADVVRLSLVVAYLENSLKKLASKNPEELKALNPVYERTTLAALLGRMMFSEEELAVLLPESARGSILHDNLVSLKMPLAMLLAKITSGLGGCSAEVSWNLENGSVQSVLPCSSLDRAKAADVFELMGREAQSPILLRKAEELRR